MSANAPRRLAVAGTLLIASLITLPVPGPAQQNLPPKEMPAPTPEPAPPLTAPDVAEAVMQALGGRPAWERTRHICFTFAASRFHCWDKYTGNHRLEGQNQQGQTFVVLSNVNTRQGTAYLDGQQVAADQNQAYLDGAYQAFANDTYWLLMPYKLQDPGVNLEYAGTEAIDGTRYEKLHLTFGPNVGLTPGDQYWAYINPATGLMERWSYILQNQDPNSQPTHWLWQGWSRQGDILLAPTRVQVGGDGRIEFTNIAIQSELPATVYETPQPMVAATGGAQQPAQPQQQQPQQQQQQQQ